jgi:hypothetical protein
MLFVGGDGAISFVSLKHGAGLPKHLSSCEINSISSICKTYLKEDKKQFDLEKIFSLTFANVLKW